MYKMKMKLIPAALAAMFCFASCGSENQITENPRKVLVVVDVQRDFFDPSGSLYVGGSEVLPSLIAQKATEYDAVVFTLDWHPGNHCSFSNEGGIWPVHCVAYTQGAGLADEFAPLLSENANTAIFLKGTDQGREEYGAFDSLESYPQIASWFANCESLDVCGIAGDYCVKESTANILKYVPAEKVTVLASLTRSIDDGSTLASFVSENGLKSE